MGKQIREQHSKVQKQKERLLRELKRAETQLRTAKDELSSANMTIEKLRLKVNINIRLTNIPKVISDKVKMGLQFLIVITLSLYSEN